MVSFDQVIAGYNFWLLVFIVYGNSMTIYICYRLRKSTTFVFLAFLALSDTLSVYGWQLPAVTSTLFSVDLPILSLLGCKLVTFFQFTAVQLSSWLLVLMSVDRLIAIKSVKWRSMFKSKHAVFASLVCTFIFILINTPNMFIYGRVVNVNGTERTFCGWYNDGADAWLNTWLGLNAFVFAYVPCGLLIIANVFLIYEFNHRPSTRFNKTIAEKSKSVSSNKKQRAMNRTVIFITVLFVIICLPGAILASLAPILYKYEFFLYLITGLNAFSASYSTYNLFILYFTNKRFAFELRSLFVKANNRFSSILFSSSGGQIQPDISVPKSA